VKRAIICGFAGLAGCAPHFEDDAKQCGVSVAQMEMVAKLVAKMRPYSGQRVGRCDLIVDDSRHVMVITPKIQRSVCEMMAREKQEITN